MDPQLPTSESQIVSAVQTVSGPLQPPPPPPPPKLDWTYDHIRTLIYWMNIANINIFLLDASIQYYKKIVMRIMAFTFLFSSLSTTVSISQLGIDESSNPMLSSIIKYLFMAASTISTILVGYIKLFKLQEMMDADTEMHKEWLDFATKISGELQMPPNLRKPALQLLQDMKASYISLFCKRPFISGSVKQYANQYFGTYTLQTHQEKSGWCGCCIRTNYIKRTNIFFVFQDIMKNEIKRLAAEIELGSASILTPSTDSAASLDGPLAAGSELGAPRLPNIADVRRPRIKIQYVYDGPFISIEVVEQDHSDTPVGIQRTTTGSAALAPDDVGISISGTTLPSAPRTAPFDSLPTANGKNRRFSIFSNSKRGIDPGGRDEEGVSGPQGGRLLGARVNQQDRRTQRVAGRIRRKSFDEPERRLYTEIQKSAVAAAAAATASISSPQSSSIPATPSMYGRMLAAQAPPPPPSRSLSSQQLVSAAAAGPKITPQKLRAMKKQLTHPPQAPTPILMNTPSSAENSSQEVSPPPSPHPSSLASASASTSDNETIVSLQREPFASDPNPNH